METFEEMARKIVDEHYGDSRDDNHKEEIVAFLESMGHELYMLLSEWHGGDCI